MWKYFHFIFTGTDEFQEKLSGQVIFLFHKKKKTSSFITTLTTVYVCLTFGHDKNLLWTDTIS